MGAAVYLRVSTEEQAEKGTLENQRHFAEGYTKLHQVEVHDWYADEGVSGTVPLQQRREGARLLSDARSGCFTVVLIYRIDRLGRSLLGLLQSVEELEGCGVEVRSMTEPFDTSSPIGRFVMSLLGSLAELERETIQERSALGMRRAAREGRWHGGPAPFGYRVGEDGRLGIDPADGATLQRIFALYREGMGTVPLAALLTAEGEPPPAGEGDGRGWNQSTIWRLLTRRLYTGEGVYQAGSATKKRSGNPLLGPAQIPFHAPVLIPPEVFAAVQSRLREMRCRSRGNGRVYLLTGRLVCGLCARRYVGGGRGSGERFYYRCQSVFDQGSCGNVALRAEEIEAHVWADIAGFVADPGTVIDQLSQNLHVHQEGGESLAAEQAEVATALFAKQEERGRVLRLVRKGAVTEAEGEIELAQIAREMAALDERRRALSARVQERAAWAGRLVEAESVLARLQGALAEMDAGRQGEVMRGMVEEILVTPTAGRTKRREAHVRIAYLFGERCGENAEGRLPADIPHLMLATETVLRRAA